VLARYLILQIPRHDPIVADCLDGKNVSINGDQRCVHVIVDRQRSTAPKPLIQFAVGIAPCNAAELRCRVANEAYHHDLAVRLQSQGLRGC
jgi:hypothetical protein